MTAQRLPVNKMQAKRLAALREQLSVAQVAYNVALRMVCDGENVDAAQFARVDFDGEGVVLTPKTEP